MFLGRKAGAPPARDRPQPRKPTGRCLPPRAAGEPVEQGTRPLSRASCSMNSPRTAPLLLSVRNLKHRQRQQAEPPQLARMRVNRGPELNHPDETRYRMRPRCWPKAVTRSRASVSSFVIVLAWTRTLPSLTRSRNGTGLIRPLHRPGCIGWLAEPGPDPAQPSGMLATAIRRSAQRYH